MPHGLITVTVCPCVSRSLAANEITKVSLFNPPDSRICQLKSLIGVLSLFLLPLTRPFPFPLLPLSQAVLPNHPTRTAGALNRYSPSRRITPVQRAICQCELRGAEEIGSSAYASTLVQTAGMGVKDRVTKEGELRVNERKKSFDGF